MSLLERILETKRQELAHWVTDSATHSMAQPSPAPTALRACNLKRSATTGRLSLIAEIKRRSPSAGELSSVLSVGERARSYEQNGAAMISVLVDATYFGGSYADLAEVRAACSLPILCKEFILDERQLERARCYGADAALLIVRCLDPERLGQLIASAKTCGLVALVEVHAPEEVKTALDAGADQIGVNARNLDTLAIDANQAERVLRSLPDSVTRLYLSGLSTTDDVRRIARTPADAALIGESLMRLADPGPLMRALVGATQAQPA